MKNNLKPQGNVNSGYYTKKSSVEKVRDKSDFLIILEEKRLVREDFSSKTKY